MQYFYILAVLLLLKGFLTLNCCKLSVKSLVFTRLDFRLLSLFSKTRWPLTFLMTWSQHADYTHLVYFPFVHQWPMYYFPGEPELSAAHQQLRSSAVDKSCRLQHETTDVTQITLYSFVKRVSHICSLYRSGVSGRQTGKDITGRLQLHVWSWIDSGFDLFYQHTKHLIQ